MSSMQNEYGEIHFGAKSYNAFRKELIKEINKIIEDNFLLAKKVYNEIVDIYKKNKKELNAAEIEQKFIDHIMRNYFTEIKHEWQALYILDKIRECKSGKMLFSSPKKNVFKKVNSKTKNYSLPGDYSVSIELNNESKTLIWNIEEGNRTVSEAYEDGNMGCLLCKIMNWISLEKGKGGIFYGNDEYEEEEGNFNFKTREWKSAGRTGAFAEYIIHKEI